METANIVAIGYGVEVHTMTAGMRRWFSGRNIKAIRFPYFTPEMLALSGVDYPDELFEAINVKLWKQVYGAKEIRITDPLGTDLTIRLDPGYWDRLKAAYTDFVTDDAGVIWPGHIMNCAFLLARKSFGQTGERYSPRRAYSGNFS